MDNPGDETVTLAKGESKQLQCNVLNGSYPPVDNIYWKHNGKYIASGTILQLRDMDQNRTGVYECTAFNGYGNRASKKFYVSVDDVEETTSTPSSLPTSARQNDSLLQAQVTDSLPVQKHINSTVVSDSVTRASHLSCLLYGVLCIVKQSADHFLV